MEIEVICKPMEINSPVVGEIFFVYDDIKLAVSVECEVTEVDVSLENTSIGFDEIYIGLKDNKSVRVHNR